VRHPHEGNARPDKHGNTCQTKLYRNVKKQAFCFRIERTERPEPRCHEFVALLQIGLETMAQKGLVPDNAQGNVPNLSSAPKRTILGTPHQLSLRAHEKRTHYQQKCANQRKSL